MRKVIVERYECQCDMCKEYFLDSNWVKSLDISTITIYNYRRWIKTVPIDMCKTCYDKYIWWEQIIWKWYWNIDEEYTEKYFINSERGKYLTEREYSSDYLYFKDSEFNERFSVKTECENEQ